MDYLRETASTAAPLYARAPRSFMPETAGDLLRAVTHADRGISEQVPDSGARLRLVRELVAAAAGIAWLREHAREACVAHFREADLLTATVERAAEDDRVFAAVLRSRFPAESGAPAL